jgi:hypothetical protein
MHTRLLISLLCAGAVALACSSFARHDEPVRRVATTTVEPTARHSGRKAKAEPPPTVNGNFAVHIEPHALHFALNLTNEGKKHVELTFPNGQQYDFTVVDSVGREVYRWGSGRMFTQSVQNKLIDGASTMRIGERAEMTLPRGTYVAVATLRSSNFPIKESSTFAVR